MGSCMQKGPKIYIGPFLYFVFLEEIIKKKQQK